MEEAVDAFCQEYLASQNIDICIAELKRKGFSQLETINAIVVVLNYNVVNADCIVRANPAWQG